MAKAMPDVVPCSGPPPRGIRNNNPGNIRASATYAWRGQSGADKDGFCTFSNPLWGLRAVCILWVNYRDFHGCRKLSDYIYRWAPPSENLSAAYVTNMATLLGIAPDADVDIHDEAVQILAAIVRCENGCQPYSLTELHRAVTLSHER